MLTQIDPGVDPAWAAVADRPEASVFISPPWIRAVCDTYGFTARAVVDVERAEGFCWAEVADLRGARSISMPFSDRAEPVVTSRPRLRAMLCGVIGADLPLTVRCLDTSAFVLDGRFTRIGEVCWHGTALRGDLGQVLGLVNAHARRNLARADRNGVTVHVRDDLAAVRVLHDLHVELRREKYRLLAQPWEFFEGIWKEFAAEGAVSTLIAEHDGIPVAAALVLAWNDVVYYKFGASARDGLHLRPNDVLFRAVLGWAVARGARLVDWGISDDDQPGLIAFKDKWASHRRRVVTLRAGGEAVSPDPEFGALLRDLTALFTDPGVPTETTRRAGEVLYRYFC